MSCNNQCGLDASSGVLNIHGEISFCNNGYTGANEQGQLCQGRNFGADVPTTDADGVVHMAPNALAHPDYEDTDFRSLRAEQTNTGCVAPNINLFEDTTVIREPNTFYVLDHVSCKYYHGPKSHTALYGGTALPFAPFVPFVEPENVEEEQDAEEGSGGEESQ